MLLGKKATYNLKVHLMICLFIHSAKYFQWPILLFACWNLEVLLFIFDLENTSDSFFAFTGLQLLEFRYCYLQLQPQYLEVCLVYSKRPVNIL